MSKDVLHKQINFIRSMNDNGADANDHDQELTLYKGKNYSTSLIKNVCRRGIDLQKAITELEERFMDTPDKDFLLMIINSMVKG